MTPVEDPVAALRLLKALREKGLPLLAFEYMDKACLDLVLKYRGHSSPLAHGISNVALIELELADLSEIPDSIPLDPATILAQGEAQVKRFWDYREIITEALDTKGFVYKHDVSLPIFEIPRFLAEVEKEFPARFPGAENFVFGHFGDGNLHLNFAYNNQDSDGKLLRHCEQSNDWLFDLVHQYQGSISAEHGIGLLKRPYLRFAKEPAELSILQSLKTLMDPHGILNPGKGVGKT